MLVHMRPGAVEPNPGPLAHAPASVLQLSRLPSVSRTPRAARSVSQSCDQILRRGRPSATAAVPAQLGAVSGSSAEIATGSASSGSVCAATAPPSRPTAAMVPMTSHATARPPAWRPRLRPVQMLYALRALLSVPPDLFVIGGPPREANATTPPRHRVGDRCPDTGLGSRLGPVSLALSDGEC